MPISRSEARRRIEVAAPVGKATLTVLVRMLGFIPVPYAKVSVNAETKTANLFGEASFTLDIGVTYTVVADSPLIRRAEASITLIEDTVLVLKPLPSWLTIAGCTATGIAVAYLARRR